MNTGIYTITNLVNSKIYVGSVTTSFNKRKNVHFHLLKSNKHFNPYLQNAYNKYGEDSFLFEILDTYDKTLCLSMESYWINILNTKDKNFGYNIIDPIKNRLGLKHSSKSKIKMSNSRKDYILKNGSYLVTDETKDKISKSKLGKKLSLELREKMSISRKGTNIGESNPFYGKKHTEKTKNKIKDAIKDKLINKFKSIAKYSLNDEFLESFLSIKEAKISLGVTSNGGLGAALKNPNKTYKGFKWKYYNN
jgi:group I intron endonuclease